MSRRKRIIFTKANQRETINGFNFEFHICDNNESRKFRLVYMDKNWQNVNDIYEFNEDSSAYISRKFDTGGLGPASGIFIGFNVPKPNPLERFLNEDLGVTENYGKFGMGLVWVDDYKIDSVEFIKDNQYAYDDADILVVNYSIPGGEFDSDWVLVAVEQDGELVIRFHSKLF